MTFGRDEFGDSARDRSEMLAGEHVLGVRSLAGRRQIEARMASDQAFARRVGKWQSDLRPFDEDYAETPPPAALFDRIQKRLFSTDPAEERKGGLWSSLRFWRGLSFGACAIAVAAVGYVGMALVVPTGSRAVIAELDAPNNPVALRASFDPADGRLRLAPVAGKSSDRSLQLWLVPGNGAPTSLGVLQPGSDGELVIPVGLRHRIGAGAMLAVSLEPLGGSPTGLPTGPVVASGTAGTL